MTTNPHGIPRDYHGVPRRIAPGSSPDGLVAVAFDVAGVELARECLVDDVFDEAAAGDLVARFVGLDPRFTAVYDGDDGGVVLVHDLDAGALYVARADYVPGTLDALDLPPFGVLVAGVLGDEDAIARLLGF